MLFTLLAVAGLASGSLAIPVVATVTDVEVTKETAVVMVDSAGHTLGSSVVPVASSAPAHIQDFHRHHAQHSGGWGGWPHGPASSSAVPVSVAPSSSVEPSSSSSSSYVQPSSSYVPASSYAPPASYPASSFTTSSAPTHSSASAQPAPTGSGGDACAGASDPAFCAVALNAHNMHRMNHTVANYTWSQELADFAATYTDACLYKDSLQDTTPSGKVVNHQSNAYACTTRGAPVDEGINNWYNGEEPVFAAGGGYGNPSPDMDMPCASGTCEIGHFANVIWKEHTLVGCAVNNQCDSVTDSSGNVMSWSGNNGDTNYHTTVICHYLSQAMDAGTWAININQPKGMPTWPSDN